MFMQETRLAHSSVYVELTCENNVDCNAEYDSQDSDEDL